jgi:S1-C subfamily serine protease
MPKIQEQSMKSLMITMRFNGVILSTGTGFIVTTAAGPALITNRHNVVGRDQITGKPLSTNGGLPNEILVHYLEPFNRDRFLPVWVARVEPLYDDGTLDGTPLWREHPRLGDKADFVALLLTKTDGIVTSPYDLAQGKDIALKCPETVSVVGFPFGISVGGRFAIWATGFIASEPEIDYDNLPLLLIDCRTRQGQSGSPVIAYRSGMVELTNGNQVLANGPVIRFVGIYSSRVNKESDIGMVWKASAIQELIMSFEPTKPFYGSGPRNYASENLTLGW